MQAGMVTASQTPAIKVSVPLTLESDYQACQGLLLTTDLAYTYIAVVLCGILPSNVHCR